MVLMDTNYAAPRRPSEADERPGFVARVLRSSRGAARVAFVAAVLLQLGLLYLTVPSAASDLAIPHLDKVVHAAMFALPAFLAVVGGLRLWPVLAVLALHAPVSELVQHTFIEGRAGDPFDMLADWAGIAIGTGVGWWLVRAAHGRRFGSMRAAR